MVGYPSAISDQEKNTGTTARAPSRNVGVVIGLVGVAFQELSLDQAMDASLDGLNE